METKELKLLLQLLGCPDYRGKLAEVKPTSGTKVSETQRFCRKLANRELVTLHEEIKKFKISPAGKTLLNANVENLPLSEAELTVLQIAAKGPATPGDTKLPAPQRQSVLLSLCDRGFLSAIERKIVEVSLSARGKEFLRDDYFDANARRNLQLNAQLLTNYINFMRTWTSSAPTPTPEVSPTPDTATPSPQAKPSDLELIEMIRKIDARLPTNNYTPIYHLRAEVQPQMTRDELDQALFRLIEEDKIQLSSLQDGMSYSDDQLAAGIPQEFSSPLFFIIVN
ncbi:hypothetical protein NEA10_06285 [Phormidium yuhuli AB48]|uniref:Uncharacterized protein n=1 Tax=Phormidium yuhuli AB48 TaxID=2940671 RepID=A0ABY5ATU2_9CYAN|nr:hypothetical protein [Phormidium yuhuli]USR92326.1 hypothetical protein NEA10_06285 [Phormidium yuhuli AB48]